MNAKDILSKMKAKDSRPYEITMSIVKPDGESGFATPLAVVHNPASGKTATLEGNYARSVYYVMQAANGGKVDPASLGDKTKIKAAQFLSAGDWIQNQAMKAPDAVVAVGLATRYENDNSTDPDKYTWEAGISIADLCAIVDTLNKSSDIRAAFEASLVELSTSAPAVPSAKQLNPAPVYGVKAGSASKKAGGKSRVDLDL
jgi:hypothetical protein